MSHAGKYDPKTLNDGARPQPVNGSTANKLDFGTWDLMLFGMAWSLRFRGVRLHLDCVARAKSKVSDL